MGNQNNTIYYNEFFEVRLDRQGADLPFAQYPLLKSVTKWDIQQDQQKFYFLSYLVKCYEFTRKQKLPHFTLIFSPTFIFHRDRLYLRNFPDTIYDAFFRSLDMCGLLDEKIMLFVEKRFHIFKPVDGGTQQLYNMLWDYDLDPESQKCYIPPRIGSGMLDGKVNFNPGMTQNDLWLSRKTLWLQDDLNLLCQKYSLVEEYTTQEILDLSNIPDERKCRYKPREFYFKIFEPKDKGQDVEVISSDSELESSDSDIDSSTISSLGLLDSTLDFEEDDKEMNKIVAFFANMPKVTGLVQGMLDMMTALTRILPLVVQKLPEDDKLKEPLTKTVEMLSKGIDKVLKICRFLGISVQKKSSGAIGVIVKDRFKKNKKEFIDYEIDELNKAIDALDSVDENPKPIPQVQPPLDISPNNLYPQTLQMGKPDNQQISPVPTELKDVPKVQPEPPQEPPKDVNGIQ